MRYVRHFLCCECSLGSHRAEFGSRWWCKSPAVICQKHSVTVSALIHFTFPDFCQSIHEIKRGLRTREMRHRALVTAFSAINASFFARNYLMGNRWKTQISGQCDGNFSERLVKAAQTSENNTKNMVIYTHTLDMPHFLEYKTNDWVGLNHRHLQQLGYGIRYYKPSQNTWGSISHWLYRNV